MAPTFNYHSRLQADLDRCVEAGVISSDQRRRIIDEVSSDALGAHVVGLGIVGVLAAAAIITFVASNWQTIPEIVRLTGLCALNAAWLGAAFAVSGKPGRLSAIGFEAFSGLSIITAIGTLALVAQMYHLPPNDSGFAIACCVITGLTALVTRTRTALALACCALVAWTATESGPRTLLLAERPVDAIIMISASLVPALVLVTGWIRGGSLLALASLVPPVVIIWTMFDIGGRAGPLVFVSVCAVLAAVSVAERRRPEFDLDPLINALFITALAHSPLTIILTSYRLAPALETSLFFLPLALLAAATVLALISKRPVPVVLVFVAAISPFIGNALQVLPHGTSIEPLAMFLNMMAAPAALTLAARLDGRHKLSVAGGLVFVGMTIMLISAVKDLLAASLLLACFALIAFAAVAVFWKLNEATKPGPAQ